jgi:hypothetical protein
MLEKSGLFVNTLEIFARMPEARYRHYKEVELIV